MLQPWGRKEVGHDLVTEPQQQSIKCIPLSSI